jgi:hypothetical protein
MNFQEKSMTTTTSSRSPSRSEDRGRVLTDPRLELLVSRLTRTASSGLAAAHDGGHFPQTVRGLAGPEGPRALPEGRNDRYAAIAALGIGQLDATAQRSVLDGSTAADLAVQVASEAIGADDPGLVALAAWARAEVAAEVDHVLLGDLADRLSARSIVPIVDLAWTLTAAVAAAELGYPTDLARAAAAQLLAAQGPAGAFGHRAPLTTLPAYRRHVGCFADQVYPIQALARWSRYAGEPALAAAERCAAVIVARQGDHGQWWWHYDRRDGSVVEGYPVYSVHQHGMAPMALDDLRRAGGTDYGDQALRGLRWVETHPEVVADLVDERLGAVWRKVGRREKAKVVRGLAAATTALRPGLTPPGLDRLAPATVIDYECRPYELGWLLYSWGGRQQGGDVR